MSKLMITIGSSLDEAFERVLLNDARARAGENWDEPTRLNFPDWSTFFERLTPNRIAILEHVEANHPPSVRTIAIGVGRDHREVRDDVTALLELGLLVKDARGLTVIADFADAELAA